MRRKIHLGTGKEVYDAGLYGLAEAIKIGVKVAERTGQEKVGIFSDAQAALEKARNNQAAPGQ
jgi:hypothetical protein